MNSMMKSAKTFPFIAVFGLYLMSNSLSSMAHFISLPEVSGFCNTCFIGASELRLLTPRLVFPSLDTSPLLLLELGCNSRLGAALGLCL